ncbi:glycoside hydrolase family 13 and glycosyltransferase family 5 protein [Exidia glandulosa HHB12029]|uniref:alpha-1,3-glucan synthase n=1 Tax=Exidia glandulosa HHB12029 TaxID=1314781 RepID=A0A165GAJ8_EXIGL|nr:glycoside hydrolase family 13 and glycosyltransferase family 5 protein [Exidia glandulosa HHB12029]
MLLVQLLLLASARAMRYTDALQDWNLNVNHSATSPLDYAPATRQTYTPSPENWRALPTYTLLLDKFADGDPLNNDFFNTTFENDWNEVNFRFGGDVKGLRGRLDYLYGMGVRAIFIAGTPFLNMPWQADSYSPIDFSILDPHWGTSADWRDLIDEIHRKNMYIILDFTVGTMADMLGFKGHLNSSTPFSMMEYEAVWKKPPYAPWGIDEYQDFKFNNLRNETCTLPTLWQDDGTILDVVTDTCYASEFDQYGDMEAFGVHPDWQRQLAKFASVQDRLREWDYHVRQKIKVFSCLAIRSLDIDGIRIDKATQVTVDALADWSMATRECATRVGKTNFFIPGEVTGGDTFGSLYIGRGRTPTQRPPGFLAAGNVTRTQNQYFLREDKLAPLDSVAFHYSTYRALCRFLGLDGNLQVAYDVDVNFVTAWNQMFVNNDFLNPATGEIDPRHMYGVTNFDVFRWPALVNGTQRLMLGMFITSLVMPGINLLYYGEEQDLHLLDSNAENYLYGRQAMSGTKAWQRHGCYQLGSEQYFNFPLERARLGCEDDSSSLDHFDPTTPNRRLLTQFNYLRSTYPALQDGFNLVQWGNWTHRDELPGSNGTQTELGWWSVTRSALSTIQKFEDSPRSDQVWLLYTNENATHSYEFECDSKLWISSPYTGGTKVRNLFHPFENYTLEDSRSSYYNDSKAPWRGCLPQLSLDAYSFKALVPADAWSPPPPMLTKFEPGHDFRIRAEEGDSNATVVEIAFEFSVPMSCDGVTGGFSMQMFSSGVGGNPSLDQDSVLCTTIENPRKPELPGLAPSAWRWTAKLRDVPDGILQLILTNVTTAEGAHTNIVDKVMLRKGSLANVMVHPMSDYDNDALQVMNGDFVFAHKAFGADLLRYTTNFGRSWSRWMDWEAATTIPADAFRAQENFWAGQHLTVQYWSEVAGSSAHVVHADHNYGHERRVPQFLARGPFNTWGYDSGIPSVMQHVGDGRWELEIMASWPTYLQLNVFGNDDYYYGDVDVDGVLDRLPPNSLALNYVNLTAPPHPHLAWALIVDDYTGRWSLEPRGHSAIGAMMYALLLVIPLFTAILAIVVFRVAFYGIKHNKFGFKVTAPVIALPRLFRKDGDNKAASEKVLPGGAIIGWPEDINKQRTVLIATLEYEIIDWQIKVKIGGLGVMSSLMGKAMTDVDLIWVIPKVQDVEYPAGERTEPLEVVIFGETYLIDVELHVYGTITYVILDSPVFRTQTKADPYPARMDDVFSAVFYSTWNQAIAGIIRRFPGIDIYHINDYHGALAPVYLLPKVIPVCLSLHNAEFQGLWPLRTKEEMKEVCSAFNISKEHCRRYVQFGNTFNLLHAAASFISAHQKSVGVAGVSDKYGKRSWARYPALWTLKHVDSLPNPDPTDIAALDEVPVDMSGVQIDEAAEAARPELKRQAQEWAGIKQDPDADLFVFVGRWSKQKGVDLIADVMPSLLEKRPSIQLVCVGPVIDLYGKFAAEKLARLVEMYPDRVFSRPEFTSLPPFIFSGADFALIPSRDEPFGLVAVEFGRKGALGVGSRLGGLGLMPGWWFPVESTSTAHMISQLTKTIKLALKSTQEERAIMRARSAVQRFPVMEWRQKIEDFHRRAITVSRAEAGTFSWRPEDCADPHHPRGDENEADNSFGLDSRSDVDYSWPTTPTYAAPPSPWPTDDETYAQSPSPYQQQFSGSYGNQYLEVPQMTPSRRGSFNSEYSDEAQPYAAPYYNVVQDGPYNQFLTRAERQVSVDPHDLHLPPPPKIPRPDERSASTDSIVSIIDEKTDSPLNQAMTTFTDADGEVAQAFAARLQYLDANNSKGDLSIEKFLTKSEEAFFDRARRDKLVAAVGVHSRRNSFWSTFDEGDPDYRPGSSTGHSMMSATLNVVFDSLEYQDNPPSTRPLTAMQMAMQRRLIGWPLYAIILALGQMLGATSFQITLLSGQNWQGDFELYVLGGVFLVSSIVWYSLFRLKPCFYVLSAPWIFFAIAFVLIGLPAIMPSMPQAKLVTALATWCYAVASAAAFLFFGLNFGEEAGVATEVYTLRATAVQGSQQLWVAALWYWGDQLNGRLPGKTAPWWIVIILWPLSIICMGFAFCLYRGLPDFYRQVPPKVPNFTKTLFRRKLVLWFLASEVLRDYWLSGPYGRNWSFLWGSHLPKTQILLLVLLFFVVVWGAMLLVLTHFSKTHTWLLPVFAVGLGAPRWCQMLWGTSSLALYIPWAGSAGPYLGTSLWLWLGVLDAIQGVGLGMILLQTLSRLHVCATLAYAQVIGCICVMVARATAPNRIGPGSVFPDAAKWDFENGLEGSPMASAPFWLALACQIVIVFGYFWFYRKEQLALVLTKVVARP